MAAVKDFNSLLTPVPKDEALLVTWPQDVPDGQTFSQYKLRPGVNLWQLNECDPTMLYTMLTAPGFVLHVTSHIIVVFCDEKYLDSLTIFSEDDGSNYLKAGPLLCGTAQQVPEDEDVGVSGWATSYLCVPNTECPPDENLTAQITHTLEELLRLLTRLPKCRPGAYKRSFTVVWESLNVLDQHEFRFSNEAVRSCFGQGGWDEASSVRFVDFQPSVSLLAAMKDFAFGCIEFDEVKVPKSFLQSARSSCLMFEHCELLDDLPPGSPALPTATRIKIFTREDLMSVDDVDSFLAKWMVTTGSIALDGSKFSAESWAHFWRCLSTDSQGNGFRTALKVEVKSAKIGSEGLGPKHLDAIPAQSWLVEWTHHGELREQFNGGTVVAKRFMESLSGAASPYFQVHDNPLLGQNPPLDARQSVILEALLRASNNPDLHYQLARTYAHTLLQPRTQAARAHDTEMSLVELRALGIDHQTLIDMLLDANNMLQQRHAEDGRRILELTRQIEHEGFLRRLYEQRQRSRTEALEEKVERLHKLVLRTVSTLKPILVKERLAEIDRASSGSIPGHQHTGVP